MVLKYFQDDDNYESAIAYVEKRRPITPPVYNSDRENEAPIPNISQPLKIINCGSVDNAEPTIENDTIDPLALSFDENEADSFGLVIHSTAIERRPSEVLNEMNHSLVEQELNDQHVELRLDITDVVRNPNQVDSIEVQNDNSQSGEADDTLFQVKLEPEVILEEVDIVELNALLQLGDENSDSFENVDDDVMIQKLETYPKPIDTQFEVKENDLLCGNIPFKIYVSPEFYHYVWYEFHKYHSIHSEH